MTTVSFLQDKKNKTLVQIGATLVGGSVLFLLITAMLSGITQVVHTGRIMPGVHVAGVDVSDLTPAEAAERLNQHLTYPNEGQIVLRDGDRVWVATPKDLGMVFDVGYSVEDAYLVGRRSGLFGNLSGQLQARQNGMDIQPVVIVDQRVAYAYLQTLAVQIDVPVLEADLHLNGSEVIYAPGQTGRSLDLEANLANLETQLQTFRDGEVELVIQDQEPEVRDASAQAEILRQMLSAPLVLSLTNPQTGDPGPWIVDIPSLAGMVTITRITTQNSGQYQVTINPLGLQSLLEEIAGQIDHAPANARFTFNDSTRQLDLIQTATSGRKLDGAATLGIMQSGLLTGQHELALVIVDEQPVVGDEATAASLGIAGLVSEQITYFRGSDAMRMQNIEIASARFHGLLIAPGETFSMGDTLGDVSLENGYEEAMIIYNGRTIKGVGGGVCQVSTTLFRTAFFGGYPIVERTPHAYRVRYYEQDATGHDSNLAGLDATVYFPLVDLKFTNDRPYYLLMEVYVNKSAKRITWKFYSTDDGRSVDWDTTGPMNIVPAPEPFFQMNPDLSTNEINQIDWPADGADISVTRTVLRGRIVLFNDKIQTHYQQWQAICEYGPGTDDWVGQAAAQDMCQSP